MYCWAIFWKKFIYCPQNFLSLLTIGQFFEKIWAIFLKSFGHTVYYKSESVLLVRVCSRQRCVFIFIEEDMARQFCRSQGFLPTT